MPLPAGTRFGPHEVIALVGRGGMGEVYRATDTTLKRSVAIKVLPEAVAADRDRLARLQREAEVLAALNHPNIAGIHGLEKTGGATALVMEFVEGPTLADRLASGPLGVDESLTIARQITEALEAAHAQGVIHRDLKPSNIKVKENGTVKVLDFGLAKVVEPPVSRADPVESPTVTALAMTQAGVLLGTAAYMSPEQVKRRPIDKRCDIWAFGCVLYEMLSGTPPFDGESPEEVLGAVVRLEPDWLALPATVPPGVRAVVKRCLQKDPALRMRDITDARFQIEDAGVAGAAGQPAGRGSAWVRYAGWMVAALVTVAAAIVLTLPVRGGNAGAAPEVRLQIVTPPGGDPLSFAISPDGLSVVYAAGSGEPRLWLRPLASETAQPLADTEHATMPFWSPDSRSIGFFVGGQLKRIDLVSGIMRALAPATLPRRGTWNRDGTIVFGAASVGPLFSVSAEGGAAKEATALLPGQTGHRWPQFLPDGRRFLFVALGAEGVRGLYRASLDDPTPHRVSDRESAYSFMAPAQILFARQGALWARGVDPGYSRSEGEFVPVAPKVAVTVDTTGYGAFSASTTGAIAYRPSRGLTQLAWLDRNGRTVGPVGSPDDGLAYVSSMASDGRTVSVVRQVDGNVDVWLMDTSRGGLRRLTFDPAVDGVPVLSNDGTRLIYASDGKADVYEIYERRTDGTGDARLVLETNENKNPSDLSPDGQHLLYTNLSATDADVWALPLAGERKPIPVVQTPRTDNQARFSPDGRWIVYTSEETGRSEIYVQPFPGPGPRTQVSVQGGRSPRWRRDQRELFYATLDNRLVAVGITTQASGVQVETPRDLFLLPTPDLRPAFEPSGDGQRFLVMMRVSDPSPITVILNWRRPG